MFLKTFFALSLAGWTLAHSSVHFLSTPAVERFPDGALEWKGLFTCGEPSDWIPVTLEFSLDFDLDGKGDKADTLLPAPMPCLDGQVEIVRTLFPEKPGILTVTLKSGTVLETRSSFCGQPENFLSLRTFCARPLNGEPEWIEIRNASTVPIPLEKIRLEGKTLAGAIAPGESIVVTGDSTALRAWRSGIRILETGAWSYLRNTGDTLRLNYSDLSSPVSLDTLVYGGSMGYARESCLSLAGDDEEEAAAAGAGYAVEVSPRTWKSGQEPLSITVTGAAGSRFSLRIFDLDGFERCGPLHGIVPATVRIEVARCGSLPASGTVILHAAFDKAAIRKAIQMGTP